MRNLACGCWHSIWARIYILVFVMTRGKWIKGKPDFAVPLSLVDSQRQYICEWPLPFKPSISFALDAKVKFLKKIHPNRSPGCLPWRLHATPVIFVIRKDFGKNIVIYYNGNRGMSHRWCFLFMFVFRVLVAKVIFK